MTNQTLKNQKGIIHLKFVTCFRIPFFLNNRSFVHFADSGSGGGVICCSFLLDVMGDLKKNNMKKANVWNRNAPNISEILIFVTCLRIPLF